MLLYRWIPLRFVTLVLCAFGLVTAEAARGQSSILSNPGFESGTTGWTFFTNGTGGYAISSPGFPGNNAARLTITTTGNNMQLYQAGVSLKANTSYTLSFAAYSSSGSNLMLSLQKHVTPFTVYGLNNVVVDVGTSWNTHTVVFTTAGFSGTVNDGRFRFVFNSQATAGSVYFIDNVLLYETPLTGDPPSITAEPQDQSVESGSTAAFSVTATGTGSLAYQWQRNDGTIAGATSLSYTTPVTSPADSGTTFRCIVSNAFGSDTSVSAVLSVFALTPDITLHPQDQNAEVGQTATFTVVATGTAPLSYQWQKDAVDIPGALNPSYITPATILADSGSLFRCIVSSPFGSDTSTGALLLVGYFPPSVTQHPQNQTVEVGQPAAFSVTATGTPPLGYQWRKNGIDIPAATLASYAISSTVVADSGSLFTCIVSSPYGLDTSNAALLRVTYLPPSVIQHPQDQSVEFGQTASFTVTATGTQTLTYQWQKNGADIPGAANSSYTAPATVLADSGSLFRCIVSSPFGMDTSDDALLRVTYLPPDITQHPQNLTVPIGQPASFTVTAAGTLPLTYQWQRNGSNISGATNPSYTIPSTGLADSGSVFSCIVAGPLAADTSDGALLQITYAVPGITQHPQNQARTSGQSATFSVTATGTQPLWYQWQRNNVDIPGATSPSYATPPVSLPDNGATFRCVVSNVGGSTPSNEAVLTVSSAPLPPNLLANPGFESGTGNWTFFTNGTGNYFAVQPGFEGNNAARLTTTTTGNNIQFYQTSFSLKANTNYTLSFAAYSSTGRDFALTAQRHSAPNTAYGLNNVVVDLGTSWNTYTVAFTSTGFSGTTTDTRFRFVLNSYTAAGEVYFIDNVMLYETPTTGDPPFVLGTLADQTIASGTTATFSINAVGTAPLAYQWRKNGVNIPGAVNPSYTTPVTTVADNGATFRCRVTNPFGIDSSNAAVLTVQVLPPTVSTHPQSQAVEYGQTATFSVAASGTVPFSYQWQKNGVHVSGATNPLYTTPVTTLADSGSLFRCIVTNSAGIDTSDAALLQITYSIPVITQHPPNRSVEVGQTAQFNVVTTGTQPLSYHWQKNNATIPGATSASYTTPATGIADSGSVFRCIVTNPFGADTSDGGLLAATYIPPVITQDPLNKSIITGQTAIFSIVSTGTPPLTYQWQRNGADIAGAASSSYTSPVALLPDDGTLFRCIVSNPRGSDTSGNALLTVSDAPPPMTNLSPRPGDIYKEFTRIMSSSNKEWRVTDPNAGHTDAQQFKPNSILSFNIADTVGIIRAEALIDQFGGHAGTRNKQFRLNAKAWLNIPELGEANGIPSPFNGQCYLQQLNPVVQVPVSHLKQGTNTIEGTSGNQSCQSFNWGQWGWYAATIRVYYHSGKTHPVASITSPSSGTSFGENPTITVNASGGAGVNRVEVLAYYEGFDTDGDGIYLDYHQSYHRLKTESSLMVTNHVGTALVAPYQVTWNTDFVPDQVHGTIRLIARVRDNNGVWFVTDEVTGLTLQRDSISVRLYKPTNVPERYNVRAGAIRTSKFTIPGTHNLVDALSARVLFRTWNGTDKGALAGETNYVKVNNWAAPKFGADDFYSYDVLTLPTSALISGVNTVALFSQATGHGIDVLWPGPAVVVRYSTVPAIQPSIVSHPSDRSIFAGDSTTFTVSASGSTPLDYQWQRNGVNIAGAILSSYTTPPTTLADNGALYRCVVSNRGGTATSNAGRLTVQAFPAQIEKHPASQTILSGRSATFVVVPAGTEPFTYQWRRNGVDLAGAVSAWYTTPTLFTGDHGTLYSCVVTNAGGTATTNDAVLTMVTTTPPSSAVSDDFNASLLNNALWTFLNPGVPSTLSMIGSGTNDALLSMNIPAGSGHDMWTAGPMSPRILQPVNNTDFHVEIKFQSNLPAVDYVGQGLVVEQDQNTYIRFNFTRRASGSRVYAATFTNGTPSAKYDITIAHGNPMYMRVQRTGNNWIHRYSFDGTNWTTAGSFNFTMTVGRVGPYFSNSGTNPAVPGLVDYFFNMASPISPEDGAFVPASIATQPSDQAVIVGSPAAFTVGAVGSQPLAIQWQRNGVNIGGANNATYHIAMTKQSDNGALFRCIVSNSGGADTTNTASLTILPHASGMKSHDFNVFGLTQGEWGVVNPLGALITTTGTNTPNAYLTFSLPAGTSHDLWSGNNFAPRLLQTISNTDFEIEAKFESEFTAGSQTQGIIVQQDAENLVRFDFTRKASGTNIFAATFVNGTATIRHDVAIAHTNPSYMRVKRQGNLWTQSYSANGTTWTPGASFTHTLAVTGVGPFAGNAGTPVPAFTSNVDYFFNTADPVEFEDGSMAVDTFPPVLLQVTPLPGAQSFLVNWGTNEPATSRIEYGLTTGYELGTVEDTSLVTSHTLQVTGLQSGIQYNFRVLSADAAHNTTAGGNLVLTTSTPTPPVIDLWYGKNQSFGHNGDPQPYINILGNVSDPHGIAGLVYSLNGGPDVNLTVGPDTRRLAKKGDFNVDILYSTLLPHPQSNQVIITARDSQFTVARETVMVNYASGNSWPKTYLIDWSAASSIQQVAQVVDGKWALNNGNLRVVTPGYDRLVAIGEQTWNDYEITAPVTIHSVDSAGFPFPSNGAGVGFLMRWPGHSDLPASTAGRQPKTGYLPLGSLSWYAWDTDFSQRMRMYGNNLVVLDEETTGRTLSLGTTYIMKARIRTIQGVGGQYLMKVWQSGTPEPSGWDISGEQGFSNPQTGSVLLVAHNLDVSFGNVTVVPLDEISTIVSDDFFADTLNSALWTLANPLGDGSYQLSGSGTLDARVALNVPSGTKHEPWSPSNTAVQLLQPANNVNFEVEAKFDSPFDGQVQMHGIIIKQDATNFIRFDYSSSGSQTKIFAGTAAGATFTPRYNQNLDTLAPPYMRVKRIGNQWTQSFSHDGVNWTTTALFVHAMTVTAVGPYAGNAGAGLPGYTALVDYFFNREFPIPGEDGGGALPPSIITEPVSKTVASGDTASFSIVTVGTPPLTFQWQRNGVNIAGANTTTYAFVTGTVSADNGAKFRCIVSNSFGADTSLTATLSVVPALSTIVSEDFHTGSLNTDLWTFVNPRNDASLSFSGEGTQDARLSIHVPSTNTHDSWTGGNFGPRIMQKANNTDFEMEAKFESGVNGVHQFQGIIAQQNTANYVRFDFTTHATSNISRAFSAKIVNNTATTQIALNLGSIPKGTAPLWLRVKRQGDLWTMSYSTNGSTFTTAGSYTHAIVVDSVGVFAGNAGNPTPEFTCIVDYVFNLASPIVPEDGVPPVITSGPTDRTVIEGQRAMFSVSGGGSPPLTYQWKKNGVNITGATSASYTTLPAQLVDDGSTFQCILSNQFGNVPSSSATLHVNEAVPLPWWDTTWAFRIPVRVGAAGFERHDKPVETALNLTTGLATLGHYASTLDMNSLRLVEVDSSHGIIDTLVPFQFDPDNGFHATTHASGTMIFMMNGITGANVTRYYDLYFDTTGGSFTPPDFPAQVSVSDTSSYEGQPSFRIVTSAGTYYYHKPGGGFASMFDNNGNDWIGYHPPVVGVPGAFNEFRGIPNAGDVFHPGYTSSSSSLAQQGPLRSRIRTTSNTGLWEAVWDIFPHYARMTMVKNGANYWFLYEGTPGGQLDLNGDFVYRSTGARNIMAQSWSLDLPSPEWAYFGDQSMQRVLYAVHHEDDNKNDYFRQQDGGMTVFGFGRKDPCCIRYIEIAPQTFTVGFAEDSTFTEASKIINSSYRPLNVVVDDPQYAGSAGVPVLSTIVSDNFNAVNLNTDLWTYYNPLGDAQLSMTGSALSINVPSGTSHDAWDGGNNTPRIMQSVNNANFEVEAKFLTNLTTRSQIQGVIVEQDPAHYLRFDFVRSASGTRVFAASLENNTPIVRIDSLIADGNPMYLRVKRLGNSWKLTFSYNGSTWITAGTFTHNMALTRIGPFFGNAGPTPPLFIGTIDYFYNAEVPIVPTKAHAGDEDLADAPPPVPTEFFLKPNYPNPFNPVTTIQYGVPEPAAVTLKVYNMLGQEVVTLVDGVMDGGYYSTVWDGRNNAGGHVGSGVYVYRMHATGSTGNTFSNLKKMILVR